MKDHLKQFYKDHASDEHFQLSAQAKSRVKEKIFAQLGSQLPAAEPTSLWSTVKNNLLRSYVIVPLAIVLFVAGTTAASADALPGEKLYTVKRQVENLRLWLAPTEQAKLELQIYFAERRLEEAQRIQQTSIISTDIDTKDVSTAIEQTTKINIEEPITPDTTARTQEISQTLKDRTSQTKSKLDRTTETLRQETDQAFQFLNETQKDLRDKGNTEAATQIEQKIRQFEQHKQEIIQRSNQSRANTGNPNNSIGDSKIEQRVDEIIKDTTDSLPIQGNLLPSGPNNSLLP